MAVRRLLHQAGYRFRVHRRDLPGKPDIVFGRRRKVVFVHGCFWHQHVKAACLDGRRPKSNTGYWNQKLERNGERDRLNAGRLKAEGWEVFIVWECEVGDAESLMARLMSFLGQTRYTTYPTDDQTDHGYPDNEAG